VRTQPHPYRLSSRRRRGRRGPRDVPTLPLAHSLLPLLSSANDLNRHPAPRPKVGPPFSTSSTRRKKMDNQRSGSTQGAGGNNGGRSDG
ncbi:unnamed protein product, partial [Ectocarpus sp. 12 AP-2014]